MLFLALQNKQDGLGVAPVADAGQHITATTGGQQAQSLSLQSIASQIQRELHELRTNQMVDRVAMQKNFILVNINLRRIAVQPGVQSLRGTVTDGNDDGNSRAAETAAQTAFIARAQQASLSPNPKTCMSYGKNMKLELLVEKRPVFSNKLWRQDTNTAGKM